MLDYARQEGVLVFDHKPYYMVDIINANPKVAIFYDIEPKSLARFNDETLKGNVNYNYLNKDNEIRKDTYTTKAISPFMSKLGSIIRPKETKQSRLHQRYKKPLFASTIEKHTETNTGKLTNCIELKDEQTGDSTGIYVGVDKIVILKTVYTLDDFGKYDNIIAFNLIKGGEQS